MKIAALILLSSLVGVAAARADGDGAPTEISNYKAEYSVPVNSSRLKKFAKFQITSVKEIETASGVEVHYTLPVELTGVENEVVFKGAAIDEANKSAPRILTSPNGAMNCASGASTACSVRFKNLVIDPAARLEVLRGLGGSASDLRARLAVASRFSGDPGGVLRYSH